MRLSYPPAEQAEKEALDWQDAAKNPLATARTAVRPEIGFCEDK